MLHSYDTLYFSEEAFFASFANFAGSSRGEDLAYCPFSPKKPGLDDDVLGWSALAPWETKSGTLGTFIR